MACEVRITPDALAALESLHEPILARVNRLIEKLESWPDVSGSKPLRGQLKGYYRVRTGDWRLIFRVAGNILTITAISNRKSAYED